MGLVIYAVIFIIFFVACFETGVGGLCNENKYTDNIVVGMILAPDLPLSLSFPFSFLIVDFLIGAVIGFIIGKIKQRKKEAVK